MSLRVTNTNPRASDLPDTRPITRYALQHRTSKLWLAFNPTLEIPLVRPLFETPHESEAYSSSTMTGAELARLSLDEYAECYDVIAVQGEANEADV